VNTADAQFYWANHPAAVAAYRGSESEPHRGWALEAVQSLAPPTAVVLEVGCHCGPLLRRLGRAGYLAHGLDINAGAVAAAIADGLFASVGAVPGTLDRYGDQEVDVVVTSYCLAYIAPKDLPEVLAEMVRIARRGVVIVEPMAGAGVAERTTEQGSYTEWRHDYFLAFDKVTRIKTPLTLTRRACGPHAGINGVVIVKRGH
jgi:ubiquinone/menaquinone biosynthesis C-methylase UbiE